MIIAPFMTETTVQRTFQPAIARWVDQSLEILGRGEGLYPSVERYARLDKIVTLEGCPTELIPFIDRIRQSLADETLAYLSNRPHITEKQRPAFDNLSHEISSVREQTFQKLLFLIVEFFKADTRAPFIPRRFLHELRELYLFIRNNPSITNPYLGLENLGGIAALDVHLDRPIPSISSLPATSQEAFQRLLSGKPNLPIARLEPIDNQATYGLIHSIIASATGVWADFGTGNGTTLCGLARKNPNPLFVGVDLFVPGFLGLIEEEVRRGLPGLSDKPSNARYVLMRSGQVPNEDRLPIVGLDLPSPESLMGYSMAQTTELVTRVMGRYIASEASPKSVVSLFYPYTADSTVNALLQIKVGLNLLQAGGALIVITEKPQLINKALMDLMTHATLDSIVYSEEPLSSEQLRSLGITPYTVRNIDLSPDLPAQESYGQFGWGYALVLRKK